MDKTDFVFLDSYGLQRDMRIRLPKCVQDNLGVQRGVTRFDIFLDIKEQVLVLKPRSQNSEVGPETDG